MSIVLEQRPDPDLGADGAFAALASSLDDRAELRRCRLAEHLPPDIDRGGRGDPGLDPIELGERASPARLQQQLDDLPRLARPIRIREHVERGIDQRDHVRAARVLRRACALEHPDAGAIEREPRGDRRHRERLRPEHAELLFPAHRRGGRVELPRPLRLAHRPWPRRRMRPQLGAQREKLRPRRFALGMERRALHLLADRLLDQRGLAMQRAIRDLREGDVDAARAGMARRELEGTDLAQRQPREHRLDPVILRRERQLGAQRLGADPQRVLDLVLLRPGIELLASRERAFDPLRRWQLRACSEMREHQRDGVLAQKTNRTRAAGHQAVHRRGDHLHAVALRAIDLADQRPAGERARHHTTLAPVRLTPVVERAGDRTQVVRGDRKLFADRRRQHEQHTLAEPLAIASEISTVTHNKVSLHTECNECRRRAAAHFFLKRAISYIDLCTK